MVNQIKENETVRACSITGADKKIYTKFLSKNMKGRDPMKELSTQKKLL
jgi:hypothetical protein